MNMTVTDVQTLQCTCLYTNCFMLEKPQETVNLKDVSTHATLKSITLFCVFGLVHVTFNGRAIIHLINQ